MCESSYVYMVPTYVLMLALICFCGEAYNQTNLHVKWTIFDIFWNAESEYLFWVRTSDWDKVKLIYAKLMVMKTISNASWQWMCAWKRILCRCVDLTGISIHLIFNMDAITMTALAALKKLHILHIHKLNPASKFIYLTEFLLNYIEKFV